MAGSVTGQSTDGRSINDATTVASDTSGSSNRVLVEQVFPQHMRDPVCLLPANPNTSMGANISRNQSCTVSSYSIDQVKRRYIEASEVDLSAFLALIDPDGNHSIELCCNPEGKGDPTTTSFFRFEFEDEIRKIQLLPLPLNTYFHHENIPFYSHKSTEVLGVLLLVVSKRGGLSVHSLVLTRKSEFEQFQLSEFLKVSRGTVDDVGNAAAMSSHLHQPEDGAIDPGEGSDPILYVALSACPKNSRSCRVDCLACPLVCHKCPLFRFMKVGPTRALKRSLVLTATGNSSGLSITTRQFGNEVQCTLAAIFENQMKVISLPPVERWSSDALKAEDIKSIPLDDSTLRTPIGLPISMIPIQPPQNDGIQQFAILCKATMPVRPGPEPASPLMSPPTLELSPRANHLREGPPSDWSIGEAKREVHRVQEYVHSTVNEALQEGGMLPKKTSSNPQTPVGISKRKKEESFVMDGDFRMSIRTPEAGALDRSGNWAASDLSTSMSSPLVGLRLVETSETPAKSGKTGSISQYNTPQQQNDEDPLQRKGVSHIVIVEVVNDDKENQTRTQVLSLPAEVSASEAIALHCSSTELILASKTKMSPEVRVFRWPLASSSETTDKVGSDSMTTIMLQKMKGDGSLQSLEVEPLVKGRLRISVTSTRPMQANPRQVDLGDHLTEHFVTLERLVVSPQEANTEVADTAKVEEKLDLIMKTLLRFEASVNDRLRGMEHHILANTTRLDRIEETLFSSRAEI